MFPPIFHPIGILKFQRMYHLILIKRQIIQLIYIQNQTI